MKQPSPAGPTCRPQAEAGGNPAKRPISANSAASRPPIVAPQPIFLPYTLVSGGATTATREGLDVKYPITTTLTGVASLFPDFQTSSSRSPTSASPTRKSCSPTSAPSSPKAPAFCPSQTLVLLPRVGDFDGGVKLAGKTDATTVGLLGTTYRGDQHQDVAVVNLAEDLGSLSKVGFSGVGDTQAGAPRTRSAACTASTASNPAASRTNSAEFTTNPGSAAKNAAETICLSFSRQAPPGKPSYSLEYDDIGPDFDSRLGYVPYTDERGYTGSASYLRPVRQRPRRTALFRSSTPTITSTTPAASTTAAATCSACCASETACMFSKSSMSISTRSITTTTKRPRCSGTSIRSSTRANSRWSSAARRVNPTPTSSSTRAISFRARFSAQLSYDESILGPTATTQLVLTGNYRLSTFRTLGGRIVAQQGHTNLYVAYGQQGRTGNDVFLIFGDPNSLSTRGEVTLKVVHPMAL